MTDRNDLLDRAVELFPPPGDALEKLQFRHRRRQRNHRLAAGAVGITIAIAIAVLAVDIVRSAQPIPGDEHQVDCALTQTAYDLPDIDGTAVDIAGSSLDDLWVLGVHHHVRGAPPPSSWLIHYDGTSWHEVTLPSWFAGRDLEVPAPNDIWLLERERIVRYDGVSWTTIPFPAGQGHYGINELEVVSDDDAWASGHVVPFGGRSTPALLHWDGASWSWSYLPPVETDFPQGVEPGAPLSIATDGPTDVWVVGSGGRGSTSPRPVLLHFDGDRWSAVPMRLRGIGRDLSSGGLSVSGVIPSGDGGAFVGTSSGLVLWDGSRWSSAGFPFDNYSWTGDTGSSGVWVLSTSMNGSVVGRWNGTAWRTRDLWDSTPRRFAYAIASFGDSAVLVGDVNFSRSTQSAIAFRVGCPA